MLSFVIESVPGIIVVGREHVAGLDRGGEIVMAVEIPVAFHLNEPAATTGTTGHIARNGDDGATCKLPLFANRTLVAGLHALTIVRIRSGVTIGVVRLLDWLVIGPTSTTDHISQITLAIGGDDSHTKVMMQIIGAGTDPIGRNLCLASGPATIRGITVVVQGAKDHVLGPVILPVEAVTSRINSTLVLADNGSPGADKVLAGRVRKEDLANGRKRISGFPAGRGL